MSVDIKKLRELEAAATPGPWWSLPDDEHYVYMPPADDPDYFQTNAEDVQLIVEMRNALPDLLEDIEDQAKEIAELFAENNRLEEERRVADFNYRRINAEWLEMKVANEKLRADYDDLFNNLYKKQSDENDRLRAENERLRALLTDASQLDGCPACKLDDDLEAEGLQLLAELESENE